MHPRARRFRIHVLGCRVNHAERRELAAVLTRRGLVRALPGETADLEVVHTCSVTRRAAAKSRQAIRRASTAAASPTILVTGCLVGTNPGTARDLAGPSGAAFGHDGALMDQVDRWVADWQQGTPASRQRSPGSSPGTSSRRARAVYPLPLAALPDTPAEHVRAEVRIQDGCDAHCTFCIIPTTRPHLRSKPIDTVLEEVRRLVDLGHREIVLAGIFMGAYGHETALRRRQSRPDSEPLADLVDAVAQIHGLARLRLSSLEPGDATEALLDAMTAHDQVVTPHLHLPLQSGSNAILRRMNRQYRVEDYLEMIEQVEAALSTPDGLPPAITTDVICGFPGETETDFAATESIAKRVGFLHMHVFPYSAREGTASARWTNQAVPAPIIARRVRRLIDIETRPGGLAAGFHQRLLGRELRLIAEYPDPARSGHWMGRCDHYARVSVATSSSRGEVIRAFADGIEDDVIVAQRMAKSMPLPVLARGG